MTTVAVLADPPHPGTALSALSESTPLSEREAADLYEALLKDTVLAAERSGGETLINYRPADALGLDIDPEAELRDRLADVIDPESARFEVQVGETFAGRVGNTATHLLETEEVGTVGIARPEAALLARTDIDGAAMKLRSSPVVLGPAPGGQVGYAAFAEPIDFADCYAPDRSGARCGPRGRLSRNQAVSRDRRRSGRHRRCGPSAAAGRGGRAPAPCGVGRGA